MPVEGIYDIDVVLYAVNGENVNGDTVKYRFFSLEECKRTSILAEENTGTWCMYCPEGDYFLDSLYRLHPYFVKPVSIHYSDAMAFSGGDDIINSYFYIYPSLMVNRWLFEDEWYVTLKNRNVWKEKIESVLQRKTPFKIWVSSQYDDNGYYSATLHILPLGNIIGKFSVNLLLTEDYVSHPDNEEYWQLNGYNNISSSHFYGRGDTIKDYVFNHVLREVSDGIWGMPNVLPDTMHYGDQYDLDYYIMIKNEWNPQNMNAIAVIEFTGENSVYDRFIVAVQSQNLLAANDNVLKEDKFSVFPNPANDVIFVEGDLTGYNLFVYDMTGNLVREINKPSNTVYIGDLPPGVYILKFYNSRGNLEIKKILKN